MNAGKHALLAIGEVMAELRRNERGEIAVGFAGDTFNTAVYCARQLGEADAVAYLTRVGSDPLSADFMAMAKAESIDTSSIEQDSEKLIGIYAVATVDHGERNFSYWRGDSAARNLFSNERSIQSLPAARITYLSGISLAILKPGARRLLIDHLAAMSSAGETLLAFDSNYRPSLWEDAATARDIISEMWSLADIALPSIDDELMLFEEKSEDDVIARFSKRDWRACAIKRGDQGPVSPALAADLHPAFQPASKVVDTTAAGDSFNGGYLAAFLHGEDAASCMVKGHELASKVVGAHGAIIPR